MVFVAGFLFLDNILAKVQEQPLLSGGQVKILPVSYLNGGSIDDGSWQNPEGAFIQDLSPEAVLEDFNIDNSAYITFSEEELDLASSTPAEETPLESSDEDLTGQVATSTPEIPQELIEATSTEEIIEIPEEPEEIATSTEEIIEIIEETATTTNASSTAKRTTSSFFASLWRGFKSLFGIEPVKAEEQDTYQDFFSRSLIFNDFSVSGVFEKAKIKTAQLKFSLAGKGMAGDKLIIDYFYQDSWQNLTEFNLEGEISNALNNGYFLYDLPVFSAQGGPASGGENWDELANLKIRFQIAGSVLQEVYLDALWLEVDYEKIEEEVAGREEEERLMVELEEIEIPEKAEKAKFKNKEIEFFYTDENSDENLIIKTDQKTYIGLTRAEVYFSVTNIGDKSEQVNLQAYFPEDRGEVKTIEKWTENIPYEIDVPDFGPVGYFCEEEWQEFLIPEEIITPGEIIKSWENMKTPGGASGEYQCQISSEVKNCDNLSDDGQNCYLDNAQTGSHRETNYRNMWGEAGLSNSPLADRRNFLEKILGLGPDKKSIPQNLKVQKSTFQNHLINPGQTEYFRMKITFPPNSSGEFYIEAIGDKKGYGLLDPWWNSSWDYRKEITIDNTKVDDDLTNFPMLISTSSDSDLSSHAQSDGDDIAFTNLNGDIQYDHEIEKYTPSTGELIAWVEVPSVASSTDTTFYMYYGNTTCGSQENATGVWGSDYLGVYHLTETPDVDAYAYDSTGGNDGTFSADMTSTDQVTTGPIAGSLEFDGANDYIDITVTTGATLTISSWATLTAGATNDMLWCLNNAGTGGPDLFFASNVGNIALNTWNSFTNLFCNAPGSGWHFYTTIIQSGNTKLYIDDTLCGTANYTNPTKTSFAISSSNAYDWTGGIDETRLYNGALTESWIKAEYNNQNSPSTFYTLGSEELNTDVIVKNYGNQTSIFTIPSTNQYVGGSFSFANSSTTAINVTEINIFENGSVDAATDLENIKLFYESDTTSPYDCVSESYGGGESQFGSTDIDGFSTANGTSTFSGSVEITTTSSMCVYVVLDVESGATNDETLEIEISNPSTEVTVSSGTVGPSSAVEISGTTNLNTLANLEQLHYRWRNDNDMENTFDVGTGVDGSVSTSTTVNINTDILGSLRSTYADGIATTVTANPTGTTINVTSDNGLAADDEIFLINLRGASGDTADVGNYEFLEIQSVSSNTITTKTTIQNSYDGTTFSNQTVVVQRVPQWTNVTIQNGGTLTANNWAGASGGIVVFRADGTVDIATGGSIDMSEKGYRGGLHGTPSSCGSGEGERGESYPGLGGCGGYVLPGGENPNGGGGGLEVTGGGGGYGTAGEDSVSWNGGGADVGSGGLQHGVANLAQIFPGSGGGGCYQGGSLSGDGGDGGGIIIIMANSVSVSGSVESNGQNGQGYGQGSYLYGTGGGSGGSILIQANTASLGTSLVTATGGTGYQTTRNGGDGGVGRIRIEADTKSGTTNPTYSGAGTPTGGAGGGATFLLAEDVGLADLETASTTRLRLLISNAGGQSTTTAYRIEVAQTAICSSGSYSAVLTDYSGHFNIATSTYITDGEATSNIDPGLTDPGGKSFVNGELKDENNTTGNITLSATQFTEIEYTLEAVDGNAEAGAQYCFRLTNSGDNTNFTYTIYATTTIESAGNSLPVASAVSIDSGVSDIILIESTTKSVSCAGTVTDNDGFGEISAVGAFLYRSGAGTSTPDNNNYKYSLYGDSECVPSNGSGTTEDYTCAFSVYFYAHPTDGSSPWSGENWVCEMWPEDTTATGTPDTDNIEMDTLWALDVSSSINYSTVNPGSDTGPTNQTVTVTNTGNADMDPQLGGDYLIDIGDVANWILHSQQQCAGVGFTYGAGTPLAASTSPVTLDLTLPLPQSTTTPITDTIYWGIGAPVGKPAVTYNGTNYFTATAGI